MPSLEDLDGEVVDVACVKWKYLAILLGLEMGTLRMLEANHHHSVRKCCLEMFKEWLQQGDTASWSKLVAALRHSAISEESLAERLERDHPCVDTDDG